MSAIVHRYVGGREGGKEWGEMVVVVVVVRMGLQ